MYLCATDDIQDIYIYIRFVLIGLYFYAGSTLMFLELYGSRHKKLTAVE